MRSLLYAAVAITLVQPAAPALAFCGFYVAKADTQLFNKASKVVVARKERRTVVTMASDYQGDASEFALVIPVPEVITKDQIRIADNALIDHVDAYSAPRLVEFFDPDPCQPLPERRVSDIGAQLSSSVKLARASIAHEKALGVTIEAQYTVGEYDILILSAKQSDGLATWLTETGYKIPKGAAPVLGSYIKQDMKFFVARVNLKEKSRLGFQFLRPIQVSYDTDKFMLPIRLGTVNARGPQDMIVFMLTERGRVETTNYRSLRIPSNVDVPLFAKDEFGEFYKALFDTSVRGDDMRAVYLEYAWPLVQMCDPCAADPIPPQQLVELGATWLADQGGAGNGQRRWVQQNAFLTRLHVRYDSAHFPEDLMFQETSDSATFQGRYVLRHPFTGEPKCEAANDYRRTLPARFSQEAERIKRLTGWDMAAIKTKMAKTGQSLEGNPASRPASLFPWYEMKWEGKN